MARLCLLVLLGILYQIHAASVTVSGISSGGAMAVQFHVAYSSFVNGAGIVAGLPYYCAGGSVAGAYECMDVPEIINLENLISDTSNYYSNRQIDNPANLTSAKVYLYSGTQDTVVNPGTMQKVKQYYQNYIKNGANIQSVFNISSEHAFITNNYGSSCSTLGSPYINNCNYDQAEAILALFYGPLKPFVTPVSKNLITLGQAKFVPGNGGTDGAYLATNAYIYVPSGCASGGCPVHIAFHGCEQTVADISTTFVVNSGYNRWAEANNIVIVYPQAKSGLMNPNGCWDWWGFTGAGYATQTGVQMQTVKNMAVYVVGEY